MSMRTAENQPLGYYSSLLRQREMMMTDMEPEEMEQAAMGPYYGMGQTVENPQLPANVSKALIAQAAAIGVLVLAEVLYKKNKVLDRFLFAANGIAFGAATYFAFNATVSNPSFTQVTVGGIAGTVNGFHALGSVVATFAPESWLKAKTAFSVVRKSIPAMVPAAAKA